MGNDSEQTATDGRHGHEHDKVRWMVGAILCDRDHIIDSVVANWQRGSTPRRDPRPQQLTEVAGDLQITERLKTPTSRRTVTIGRGLADLVGEHIGRFPNEHGLVFTGTEGGMLRRSNFARTVLKPAAAKIEIPRLRMHDLRHTHASLLLAAGESIPVVAQRLGHKDSVATLRIYAHAIPGSERGPADTTDAMFGTIPTTVEGWRGLNAGYDAEADILDFPQLR